MNTASRFIKPDSLWLRQLRRSLLTWFERNARDLPWRRTRDPYSIWVSEIMLQQTQVVKVVPYFERFIRSFPDVQSLARAQEDRVMRHWEGLGYYSRARRMVEAARCVVAEHDGQFPSDVGVLKSLPGIGRYTAGAIASQAVDAREPILEANSIRVLCRLFAVAEDPKGTETRELLWEYARVILPRKQVGAFNQALMELGASVCSVRNPECEICPVRRCCETRHQGRQDEIPAAAAKKNYENVRSAAVVIWNARRNILLRRCGPDERWAGLWDFPRFDLEQAVKKGRGGATVPSAEITQKTSSLTGVKISEIEKLAVMRHAVTRFRITLECYEAECVGNGFSKKKSESLRWASLDELDDIPLNTTGRKLARLLIGS